MPCGSPKNEPEENPEYEFYNARANAPLIPVNKPVCDNQSDFNVAFTEALKYNRNQEMKKAGPWLYVYLVLHLIFSVWALLLAMKVPAGPERVEHMIFALVFGPVYVLGYYLSALANGNGSNVGEMQFSNRW